MTVGLFMADKSALERRRHSEAAAQFLAALAAEGVLATCEVVALEVLYSARNASDYRRLDAGLRAQVWLPTDHRTMQRALDVQSILADNGQHRLPIPDLVIAATAEIHGATVLHHDRDFERIGAVTGQPVRWVDGPPRGAVVRPIPS